MSKWIRGATEGGLRSRLVSFDGARTRMNRAARGARVPRDPQEFHLGANLLTYLGTDAARTSSSSKSAAYAQRN